LLAMGSIPPSDYVDYVRDEYIIRYAEDEYVVEGVRCDDRSIEEAEAQLKLPDVTSIFGKTLIQHPFSRWVDQEGDLHPALLSLCQLTNVERGDSFGLEEVVVRTQRHWLRKHGTERYELANGPWEAHREEILTHLRPLNVIHHVKAEITNTPYDIVIFHGAMAFSVKIRLEFLIAEYRRGIRFKQVVLLTGDRPLNSLREAEFIGLGLQTEAEIVQYLWYNNSGLPEDIIRNASFVSPGENCKWSV
jgi:hypothetical protein